MNNNLTTFIIQSLQIVKSALQNDLVSYDELRQLVICNLPNDVAESIAVEVVVRNLLAEDVQIGHTLNADGKYVKFVAWKGSISERIERARREAESAEECNREFAYWLCLSKNVDEYEAAQE
jgi:hypothetical protein